MAMSPTYCIEIVLFTRTGHNRVTSWKLSPRLQTDYRLHFDVNIELRPDQTRPASLEILPISIRRWYTAPLPLYTSNLS